MPSASIAAEPVITAAANLVTVTMTNLKIRFIIITMQKKIILKRKQFKSVKLQKQVL